MTNIIPFPSKKSDEPEITLLNIKITSHGNIIMNINIENVSAPEQFNWLSCRLLGAGTMLLEVKEKVTGLL